MLADRLDEPVLVLTGNWSALQKEDWSNYDFRVYKLSVGNQRRVYVDKRIVVRSVTGLELCKVLR